ncbi:di-trans,poly-cis-decaprenylcistransferase [Candidatus Woesearchaeota archaeon]|nr:di-trans,poly-cis-decaprenylcistransferase [Candidatus Woesearchaeota archaeon]
MKNLQHVGIVLDGNRRFAKRLMMKPWMGHEWGAKKTEKLFDWCKELDIREMTLFTFSVENFNRPKEEFDYLMNLFEREFEKIKDDKRIYENKIKINFIGRLNMFPDKVQEKMKNLMEKTKEHNDFIINFAMAYGGRAEILDAAKRIAEKIEKGELKSGEVDEKIFEENLYMKDKPDMIIRTSGERRTSGFLLWQSDYSEWFFVEKCWPEFEKEDFVKCIEEYKKRDRRFGK